MPEANPTFWLNHVYGTQPDGREEEVPPRRRRMIMHRWGGLGNQRYPIGFSGDTASSWASLAFQPLFTSAAANVNFGYWSHDIGGFCKHAVTAILSQHAETATLSQHAETATLSQHAVTATLSQHAETATLSQHPAHVPLIVPSSPRVHR